MKTGDIYRDNIESIKREADKLGLRLNDGQVMNIAMNHKEPLYGKDLYKAVYDEGNKETDYDYDYD